MAPMAWSWHTPVEVTVATADPANRPGDATVRGQLIRITGGTPLVRDLAIPLNPGGSTFGWAPRSSSPWCASSRELQGKTELEFTFDGPLFFYQVVLSSPPTGATVVVALPEVSQGGGTLPTETTRWDGWTWINFGYSRSLAFLTSLVASGRVVGSSWLIHQYRRGGDKGDWLLSWYGRGGNQSGWLIC